MNIRQMLLAKISAIILILGLLLSGCANDRLQDDNGMQPDAASKPDSTGQITGDNSSPDGDAVNPDENPVEQSTTEENSAEQNPTEQNPAEQSTPQPIDLNVVKPNEAGRIMVVMFHNFIEKYEKGDKLYTTTFDEFEELLETLYSSDYRLISLNDYLSRDINIPAGCIPMVFTFDDGTSGQFSLVEENGVLKVNPRSAAGIIEEFNETHPDFGVNGTFFVNLGNNTFTGAGTLEQRLDYLVKRGFEIGNHTYSHINLKTEGKNADIIQKEIGENQKKMYELIPGYSFTAFSLPYGAPSKELVQYVIKGEFEGTAYDNRAIMEVGWDPAQSPFSIKFEPFSTHRVRSSGIEPVDQDLAWWLENMKRSNEFVSDGDPNTVTVPQDYAGLVDKDSLGSRKLVVY